MYYNFGYTQICRMVAFWADAAQRKIFSAAQI